ncbi:MAG TPA: L-type lectin-domain containing protein, partial [Bacteroidia bacterium]|nr:L-type lectin-domain containing protein [Bacteroidia bacterium]
MKRVLFISTLLFFCTVFPCKAQFTLQGSAGVGPSHCSATTPTYKLTDAFGNESGQAWNNIQANLNQPFDVHFQLFLGAQPYHVGADGVAFVFQQQGTNAKGPTGEGLGFAGIQPSLAVEFDTYQNPYDPPYCHTAIEKNGDVDHTDGSGNNLAGPVQLDPSNPTIPDSNWYNMEITWTPKDSTLNVYFNCILRLSYKGDVVNGIFNGNPNVYWGFTGGTGGKDNLQEVCMAVSPAINSNDTTICAGNSIKLIASGGGPYLWSTGDTSSSILVTPAGSTNYFVII